MDQIDDRLYTRLSEFCEKNSHYCDECITDGFHELMKEFGLTTTEDDLTMFGCLLRHQTSDNDRGQLSDLMYDILERNGWRTVNVEAE